MASVKKKKNIYIKHIDVQRSMWMWVHFAHIDYDYSCVIYVELFSFKKLDSIG